MRIVFFEIMPNEREAFERLLVLPAGFDVSFHEGKLTGDEADIARIADIDIVSVFVNSELSAATIDQMPNLKLITTRSMGFDHIDVEHATSKGIKVANVKTYASHPVAEFTFALMLTVVRNLYPAYNRLQSETSFDISALQGMTLNGKTLGVIGTGRIGRSVIAIAKGFGMEVIAFDAFPNEQSASQLGFTYASLDEVLAKADVVTVHVPYSKDTHHLMNTDAFARMKPGAYLVNTARGEIVDTHALIAALENGTLAGAGLDVLEGERALKEEKEVLAEKRKGVDYELLAANHVLIDHPRVVVTPHIAFSTRQALDTIDSTTAETITNFINETDQEYVG